MTTPIGLIGQRVGQPTLPRLCISAATLVFDIVHARLSLAVERLGTRGIGRL